MRENGRMTHRIIPAIMSGGAGTRLWPLSTDAQPKQFHALGGSESLFTTTAKRVRGAVGDVSFAPPIVLCNETHLTMARHELGGEAAAFVLEPVPRNTGAVAAIAAAVAAEIDPDALVLLLPADHIVADAAAFHAAISRAAPFARDRIVTFGIAPDGPATSYGYIHRGEALGDGVFAIDSFREKPNAETARQYLATGAYCWNAGIFLFHPARLLAEFDASAEIRESALAALSAATRRNGEIHLDASAFAQVPSQPLDIAVMEKTSRAAVVPCDIGWADIGSWDEIWRVSPQDDAGNATHGPVTILDASRNLIRSEGPKVCVAGVNDLIVVATDEAVIIVPRARAQDVKAMREAVLKKP
jgi:mannose-1-phosphate guanylyltransferase/mannose-6-phosphate isomerase